MLGKAQLSFHKVIIKSSDDTYKFLVSFVHLVKHLPNFDIDTTSIRHIEPKNIDLPNHVRKKIAPFIALRLRDALSY